MFAYLIDIDLQALSRWLTNILGGSVSRADVREILRVAGFVESPSGWITRDLRPLMLAITDPRQPVFGNVCRRWVREL